MKSQRRTLRLLRIVFHLIAGIVLVSTALVVLAIVTDAIGAPASVAPLVQGVTVALAVLVGLAGLLLAVVCYVLGSVVGLLLAIDDELLAALDLARRRVRPRDSAE